MSSSLWAKAHAATSAARLGKLPAGVGLPVGSVAPDVSLSDERGHGVSLHSLLGRGALLLVFYRGGWCPYCNFQVRELTLGAARLERAGARPVVVSVDTADEAARSQAEYHIPFPVLSDPLLSAHRAFGVAREVDTANVERLRKKGMDLERSSGQTHHTIAIPSVFVIDTRAVVRFAHADLNYEVRPTVEQLAEVIEQLLPHPPPRSE